MVTRLYNNNNNIKSYIQTLGYFKDANFIILIQYKEKKIIKLKIIIRYLNL